MTPRETHEKAQVFALLTDLAERGGTLVAETLQAFGAPASAGPTIRLLATSTDPVTPRDLARRLDRDPSTATLVADRLQEAGLVARELHPSDGRKRVLVLTERGQDLWTAMRDGLHAAAFLDCLSPTERATLIELLSKMSRAARDAGGPFEARPAGR
ncbi:MarR family winged helix-turn-helix transcriptional regulator [Nocardioides bruguierae]|uniref:MarR family transcriptional regulator n=1 Tax=Nocardioides bruguierae TaxID=2945102 RepID=A0A9X2D8P4_9ACTN|nr:MarR family transcriptional regulator [Nocardioides bruguierae]MCM0621386.1 MarR family transcriptional regulator [Nocardioides bruguierae]